MQDLTASHIELLRLASTDLPPDVEHALQAAFMAEKPGSAAAGALKTILENVEMARTHSTPICQDTGTPSFFIRHPAGWSTVALRAQVRTAVAAATAQGFLRPNAVNAVTGKNSGTNTGDEFFPFMHFEEHDGRLIVDLLLKGGGSENVGAQYSLPDTTLNAARDLDGVYRAALDAVFRAQGRGCSPGVLGIAIGGDRASSYLAAKQSLFRRLGDPNPDPDLDVLEKRILHAANLLGIGPMGLGGRTSLLGVFASGLYRHTASFMVSFSYMCWAYRRRRMVVEEAGVAFS